MANLASLGLKQNGKNCTLIALVTLAIKMGIETIDDDILDEMEWLITKYDGLRIDQVAIIARHIFNDKTFEIATYLHCNLIDEVGWDMAEQNIKLMPIMGKGNISLKPGASMIVAACNEDSTMGHAFFADESLSINHLGWILAVREL